MEVIICVTILLQLYFRLCSATNGYYYDHPTDQFYVRPDTCVAEPPKSRIEYILSVRQPDYGWKEHTHRANIALAVNKYKGDENEKRRMELQLEVELTKALLRNSTYNMRENDLALYILALIATDKNPRNFYGVDLVADLLYRVNGLIRLNQAVHPFLILTLSNARAATHEHFYALKRYTAHRDNENREDTEMKALALKALTCAETSLQSKFSDDQRQAVRCLLSKHKSDGSFGNAYTSSLAVQALAAHNPNLVWNKTDAFNYLEKEAGINVNLVKAYYIEMALNAEKVPCVKDLYTKDFTGIPSSGPEPSHFITYTVKGPMHDKLYVSIAVKVPKTMNFFEIMKLVSKESHHLNFTYYEDKNAKPVIVSMDGIPNDAEQNMFWMMCVQRVQHNPHSSRTDYLGESPAEFVPEDGDHIILWYRNTLCNQVTELD